MNLPKILLPILVILLTLTTFPTSTVADSGTLWAWGGNMHGQLGIPAGRQQFTPTPVPSLGPVKAIAAGSGFTVALLETGEVLGWGRIDMGHWMSDVTYGPQPVDVERHTTLAKTFGLFSSGKLTEVVAVTAGSYHALALQKDGTVWAWGRWDIAWPWAAKEARKYSPTPLKLSNLGNISDFSARGGDLLLTRDGWVLVSAYGFQPVEGLTEVVKTAGGIVLKSDGTVWYLRYDYLHAAEHMRITVGQVIDIDKVIDVAAGDGHFLAVRADGVVFSWGKNQSGQLGDGSTRDSNTPVPVKGLRGVKTVAAGNQYSLALTRDGEVWAWGNNFWGTLGTGARDNHLTPVRIKNLGKIKAIFAGTTSCFALGE